MAHANPGLRGVNPLVETRARVPGSRSLSFSRRADVVGYSMRLAEEAEGGTAGEQPAKEYSAETHRDDEGSGRSRRPPGVRSYIGTIDFPMPGKTQLCGRQLRCSEQVLKRLWRTIAQGRV